MNSDDQSYISMASADRNLNTNKSICTSLEKYAPLIDTIRGYFVQSLETRICDGLEMFFYNDEENLSTQFIPYVKKCLDVAGNALKYFFRDGIIPCILNTIVLNNRLNKVSRNLDQMGVDQHFLRHINVQSYIYANEYWIPYENNDTNKCNCNYNRSISSRSSYTTNYSSAVENKVGSTINSRRTTDDTLQFLTTAVPTKMNHARSLTNTNGKVSDNSNTFSYDKSLQVVIRDRDDHKIYHMIELPCTYQHFIHYIVETIDSSWKIMGTDEFNEEFISKIKDICNTVNKKLDQLDNMSIKRCRLYCNIQNECIYIKLKMMDVDGSEVLLYDDRICRDNKLRKTSNTGRSDKLTSNNSKAKIKKEVSSDRNSTRSFQTINEYPHPGINNPQNNNSIDNSSPPNDDNDNFSYKNNHFEGEDEHSDCTCTSNSYCWNHDESNCTCYSSYDSFHSIRNLLDGDSIPVYKETSPTVSNKSFVNLSSSTLVKNDLQETSKAEMIDDGKSLLSGQTINKSGEVIQTNDLASGDETVLKESHISEALKKILNVPLKRASCESEKLKTSSEISEVISVVISDASQTHEVVGLERIDEMEEDDEIDEVDQVEIIRTVEDINDKKEIKESKDQEKMQEVKVPLIETPKKIDDDEKVAEVDANIEEINVIEEKEVREIEKCEIPRGEAIEKTGDDREKQEAEVVADYKELNETEKVEDYQEQEKTESFERVREARTETSFKIIDESIIPIRNETPDFMKELVTSFVRELDFSMSISPPPPSLESSGKNSLTKSEDIEMQLASMSSERIKKIRKVSTEEKFIIVPDSEQWGGSSSVFVSPCRHSRKSSASSPTIQCPTKHFGTISNKYSYSETFSDAEAVCGSSSFYVTGDSSMNNLYTVYPNEWKPRICRCETYKKGRIKTTIRLTKKGLKYLSKRFKHYYPTIKNNTKSIMAALSKRFKIVFSKKTYYKLKYFIEEKLIKTIIEREKAANTSKVCVCKMQHRRGSLNNNSSFKNIPMHESNNNFTSYKKNNIKNSDHPKSRSQSSLSHNDYSPAKQKISRNHIETCENRDSELLNLYERRRWSNLISETESRQINKLINNDRKLCRCPCCCNSIEAINYYQSTDNSVYSVGNRRHKFSSNNKRIHERDSKEFFDHQKLKDLQSLSSSSSLSSRKDYFCWYHKIFAAKYFNQYLLNESRHSQHRSISDKLDVDCGECFGPTDHNFRLMLNRYMNLCKKIECPVIDRQSINGNSTRTISRRK